MTFKDNSDWLLVYTKPKKEFESRQHLLNQGVKVYFPEIKVEKINRGKVKVIEEPLFPRYLFVQIPDNVSWTSVRSSRGVQDFVKFGNEVAKINAELVDEIVQINTIKAPIALTNIPNKGDKIVIKTGELSGIEGVFKNRNGDNRCIILLDILGRTNKVKMELSQVQKVG